MEKILKKTLKNGSFEGVSKLRSRIMQSIKGSGNYSTELKFRMSLVRAKISGWKMHPKGITGNPDFFIPEARIVIFIDGCFWHGCRKCGHIPKTNKSFWKKKIERNKMRDLIFSKNLKKQGFQVIRFWEHELKINLNKCLKRITLVQNSFLKKLTS